MISISRAARGNILTRSHAFKRLTKWAFSVCDTDRSGNVSKSELYIGLLLVHLNLAKYAGLAACNPPTREIVDELFEASNHDKTGSVEEKEFSQIMVICCAQISSRIMIYYTLLIAMVPYLAQALLVGSKLIGLTDFIVGFWFFEWLSKSAYVATLPQTLVSSALSYIAIPYFFGKIDSYSKVAAATDLLLMEEQKKEKAKKKKRR